MYGRSKKLPDCNPSQRCTPNHPRLLHRYDCEPCREPTTNRRATTRHAAVQGPTLASAESDLTKFRQASTLRRRSNSRRSPLGRRHPRSRRDGNRPDPIAPNSRTGLPHRRRPHGRHDSGRTAAKTRWAQHRQRIAPCGIRPAYRLPGQCD